MVKQCLTVYLKNNMDLRSFINIINEAEAPLPGKGQKGPTVAAAAGKDPSNPLNKNTPDDGFGSQEEWEKSGWGFVKPQTAGQATQPAVEWKPTPEQEKWLGGANRQDPYVMNRMPGDKPPVSYFKDPADQALAKQMGFSAAAKAQPTQSQAQQPAKAATTQEKIEKLNQLVDKLVTLRSAPAATQQPAQPASGATAGAATGQATQPEKTPNAPVKVDQNANGSFTAYKKDGSTVTFDKDGKILSESIIAKDLVESFGYQLNEDAVDNTLTATALGGLAAQKPLAKLGMQGASTFAKRAVPFAGSALSAKEAWDRWQKGDKTGAVISALAGAGWLLPGPFGWVVGGGLTAYDLMRDTPSDKSDTKATQDKTSDPKVLALQKFLKSQGADLGTTGPNKDGLDGVMGPKTRAAMDQLELTEAQRERFSSILAEAAPGIGTLFAQANKTPGLGDVVRYGGKTFKRAFAGSDQFQTPAGKLISQDKLAQMLGKADAPAVGKAVGDVAKTVGDTAKSAGSKIMPALSNAGGMLKKHPYAAGALGALGLAKYATSGNDTTPGSASPATPTATNTDTSKGDQATQPAKAWSDEEKELNRQIKDLSQELELAAGNDPEVKKALSAVGQKMSGITSTDSSQATQPEKPATYSSSLSDFADKIGTYKDQPTKPAAPAAPQKTAGSAAPAAPQKTASGIPVSNW